MGQEVGNAAVLAPDEAAEYDFREGCRILELANSAADPALSIARARVPAGTTTRWHRLKGTSERYVILSGQGRVEVGDLPPTSVGPGAVVQIPPLCRQRITATGPDELVFLALCTPRFRPECYEDLGAERGAVNEPAGGG
ncbi:MAG: cupin domain-containing protein [Chromatiales bacterium]|jgi:mannose-6-phosphate isomerase-like protein (cupin superfamily)|nr:cupin domain-containing protein [Chromatiales bacterium]